MSKKTAEKRRFRKDQGRAFTVLERAIGVGVGVLLGAIAGLMFGVSLACFGLTMWLWLVLPVSGAAIGGAIGWKFPFPLDDSSR